MNDQVNEQSPLLPVVATSAVRKQSYLYDYFKIGCITSKPAFVILFWSFSALLGNKVLINTVNIGHIYGFRIYPESSLQSTLYLKMFITFLFLGITIIYPVAGLLADIKFGRYKTVLCSSYIIVITMSLFPLYAVGIAVMKNIHNLNDLLRSPFLSLVILFLLHITVLLISSIIFTTNAFNFGMDQLHDSSTQDSILFVHWYVWLNYLGLLVTGVPWSLFIYDSRYFDYIDTFRIVALTLFSFIFSVILVILISSLCLIKYKQRWFLIEPGRVNPYKLVYRVVKFAWHHKIPVRRSAFTYCEDEWPSRLDLGKQKYGGPFTVEQVEDVKAFLGILKVLVSIIPLFMLQCVSELMLPQFAMHHNFYYKPHGNNSIHAYGHAIHIEGIVHYLFLSSGLLSPMLVVVSLPLYLFLLRPFIIYHIPRLLRTILKRIGVGLLLIILSLLCALAMDVVVHERNSNQLCMFSLNHTSHIVNESTSYRPRLYQNAYFFISQHVLSALYNMLIDIAVFEFIASQSPYSMKGLLIGILFSLRILAQCLGIVIIIPFSTSWKTSYPLSCGSGFYITNISIGVITFTVYVLVAKNYKHRIRDEPSFIRRYAEEYYSNIQNE